MWESTIKKNNLNNDKKKLSSVKKKNMSINFKNSFGKFHAMFNQRKSTCLISKILPILLVW